MSRGEITDLKISFLPSAASALLVFLGLGCPLLPLFCQTALPMTPPSAISRIINDRTEIERNIILGTPESLAKAKEGLMQSKVIADDDKNGLLEIVRGISMVLYPVPPSAPVSKNPPVAGPKNKEEASSFFVEQSFKNILPVYSVCLTQLVEASQGKVFTAPKGSEVSLLTEILPALAIFKTTDKDTARAAWDHAERFEKASGQVSVIMNLVKAHYARIVGDPMQAYLIYKRTLEAYPDVWPARLGLGELSLEFKQPVNALSYLAPLAGARRNDPCVMVPYATALYQNGRFAEAEPIVEKCIELAPESPDIMLIGAHIFLDKNDFSRASPLLDAYGKKKPADRMYLYLRATYLKGLNRDEEALKWARKALQLYPADPEIMVLLADILFGGPETGHEEAVALCNEAQRLFSNENEKAQNANAAADTMSPLQNSLREQAKGEAARLLILEAYNHQDWFAAASMLEYTSTATIDKTVVSTVLRKSGRIKDALAFSGEWYKESPQSEEAAEAYLRSLAAASTGAGIASAVPPGSSDMSSGIIGLTAGSQAAGVDSGQASLIELVLHLLSGSYSSRMRSYLYYLRGNLQTNEDAAIDSYRMALLERADNTEALAALAELYARKKDNSKALFYIRQAKAIGINDADLAARLHTLETSITSM